MTRILTIDPGISAKSGTGWACFDGGTLPLASRLLKAGIAIASPEQTLPEKCRGIIETVTKGLQGAGAICPDVLLIEHMVVYPMPRMKGDPNDLIDLAVLEGAFLAMPVPTAGTRLIEARAWKGQVPKKILQKRIESKLRPEELATFLACTKGVNADRLHNVWDAVGIGLHWLGRL